MVVPLVRRSGCLQRVRGGTVPGLLFMYQRTAVRPERQQKPDVDVTGSQHARPAMNDAEVETWQDATALALRLMAMWKRAVAQAEADLVRFGCGFAALDLV